jgi:hypothetical protein
MRRAIFIVTALTASAILTSCDGSGSSPTAPSGSEARPELSKSAPRSGAVHIEKDCTDYRAGPGDHCTITKSNVDAIPVGSVITYATGAVGVALDTDVIIDPPKPGNNVAFGHCALDLSTGIGRCTISGGTGKYKRLHASVAVSPLGGPMFAWDGTYAFSGNASGK